MGQAYQWKANLPTEDVTGQVGQRLEFASREQRWRAHWEQFDIEEPATERRRCANRHKANRNVDVFAGDVEIVIAGDNAQADVRELTRKIRQPRSQPQ